MSSRPTVLVTGATGAVARGTLPFLDLQFTFRRMTVGPAPPGAGWVTADVLDLSGLERVLEGVDTVLHLAVATGHSGTFEDDAFNDARFDVNVKGTFHVFEAARRTGVRRVVLASSAMVTWGHALRDRTARVPGDAPPAPVGTYALTKALGEQVARHYAERHGLEVACVRITAPLDVADPAVLQRPVRPQQIPWPDLARAFALALTVPLSGFQVVTIAGLSSRCPWDLGAARRVLGYEPRIDLDALGLTFAEPFDVARE